MNPIMPSTVPSEIPADKLFDVVQIPCSVKHRLIMERWDALPVDDYFVLKNDHDPIPLFYQFDALFNGCFTWDYLERGPEAVAVRIGKVKQPDRVAAIRECHS